MGLTRRELLGAAVGGGVLAAGSVLAEGQQPAAPGHVVLLGDSIFDNGAFVRRGQATVVEQLRSAIPAGWRATLLAAANSTTDDILRQLDRIPRDATHLVLSAGGNDAIRGLANLLHRAQTPADVFAHAENLRADFERRYGNLLRRIRARELPTLPCTIPAPDFTNADPLLRNLRPVGMVGLSVYNDVVTRAGVEGAFPLLDLRLLILPKPDHAADGVHLNPAGGRKLAERIARIVREHDFAAGRAIVYS